MRVSSSVLGLGLVLSASQLLSSSAFHLGSAPQLLRTQALQASGLQGPRGLTTSRLSLRPFGPQPHGSQGLHRKRQTLPLRMQANPESQEDAEVYSQALRNTGICVAAAAAFGAGIWTQLGSDKGIEFLTGYVLEESLSVDNLFVFILLFEYFKVPQDLQKRVLTWGIIGAIVLRGAFISAGLLAIRQFRPVLLGFAGFLLFSSYKILTDGGEEDEEEDLSNNAVVKFASKVVKSTKEYDGENFFTTIDGVKRATPLLLVLFCVELSDILFAVDSIPAVFGVTEDPLIVFSSNIFAILGLRALFQVISKLVSDLEYLESAVGLVLGFIGLKLIGEFAGMDLPEEVSLAVVTLMLGGGVALSKLTGGSDDDDDGGDSSVAASSVQDELPSVKSQSSE